MIENIIGMVKDNLGGDLMSKFGMSSEQADKTITTGSESFLETLKNKASSGDLSSITSMFGGGNDNVSSMNAVGADAGGNIISNLVSKVGLPQGVAEKVTEFILPKLTEIFSSKLQGGSGGFDLSSITSMFGNSNSSQNSDSGVVDNIKDALGDKLGGLGNLIN